MKKYTIILLLLAFFGILQSTTLKRFYYKDYGYVNRLVFVFSSKPQYQVLNANKQIQIEITNAIKSQSIPIRKKIPPKNIVIKEVRFLTNQGNILVLIDTHSDYYLKKSVLLENGYKVVLDVFKSKEAYTAKMHRSYASFYSAIGYKKKAHWHIEQAKLLEEQEKKSESENIKETKEDIEKNIEETKPKDIQKKEITIPPKFTDSNENTVTEEIPKKILIPFDMLIFLAIVATIIILALILIIPKNKKTKEDDNEEKSGLGDEDFNTNLVIILFEKGWKVPEIAREVNLSEKAVKKIKKENKEIIKR